MDRPLTQKEKIRALRTRILQVWDDREQRGYRNGLMDALAIVTGDDDESLYLEMEEEAIARAEILAALGE